MTSTTAITIPRRLGTKLGKDPAFRSMVEVNLSPFSTWYEFSGTPFFREYTNHGARHVNDLLMSASALIRDDTFRLISTADVAVFALAALLHDVAMHLTPDCFLALINPTAQKVLLLSGDKPWPELWDDYLNEALRFDEKQIKQLFGEMLCGEVRRPSDDSKDWNEADKKLIGEFIRRHHPRIAHEIARFGVPGSTLSLHCDEHYRDLVGFIARSHGLGLRECFDYIELHFHLREFRSTHPVYLIVLLRLADYLQVQDDRAPRGYLQVQTIRSPLSAAEWKVHEAIVNITTEEQDPELIRIDARPKDVKTYLRLKKLFADIQAEFDASWAVLGEVFGRFKPMGLRLRRLRSTLDDGETFARSVDFVPRAAALAVSPNASKLLKLLVEPLYGHHAEIGIRELLQNSVDAVRERDDYRQRRNPQFQDFSMQKDPFGEEVDAIAVCLETRTDGSHYVVIADGGIGMTADTIIDYFLTAGSSFRDSAFWRKHHTADGHSRVLRSGRFGIGVLACFLLGSRARICSRHISCPPEEAIRFEISFAEEVFELRKTAAPIGTRIEIEVSQEMYKELKDSPDKWFWYLMDDPAVLYCIDGEPARFWSERNPVMPSGRARVPGRELKGYAKYGWRRIENAGYPITDFAYDRRVPALCCNGIRILDRWPRWEDKGAPRPVTFRLCKEFLPFKLPSLSIHDPDGLLPLEIRRVDLASVDENLVVMAKETRLQVAAQYAVDWQKQAPRGPSNGRNDTSWMFSRGIFDFTDYKYQIFMYSWCAVNGGVTLLLPTLLRNSGVRRVFFLERDGWESIPPNRRQLQEGEAVLIYWLDSGDPLEIFREFITEKNHISHFVDVAEAAVLLPKVNASTAIVDRKNIPSHLKNLIYLNLDTFFGYRFEEKAATKKWTVRASADSSTCERLMHWADLLAEFSDRWQMAGAWTLSEMPSGAQSWQDEDIAHYFISAFQGAAVRW